MDLQQLAAWVVDARARTLALAADLTDEQLLGPRLPIVNPLRWELGHVAWFQERWVLRHGSGLAPLRIDGDALYDSSEVPHRIRWDLPLPSRAETMSLLERTRDRVLERLRRPGAADAIAYLATLSVFHEDMHDEAFTYTRQTHAWAAPPLADEPPPAPGGGPLPGDVVVPGGRLELGAPRGEGFVFDNEKWAHPVELRPFAIARSPVTEAELARWVDDGGYERRELWSDEGWAWRTAVGADRPWSWRRGDEGWEVRRFDRWRPLAPHHPALHVAWWEAEAYCRWAGRRLPTEAEWEAAAVGEPDDSGRRLAPRKRRFPWGDEAPTPERANLDAARGGTVEVGALPAGDSAFGCRQMIGNVWEWTASPFLPYPGFLADPYRDYSQPWFGTHRVLRGGCWVTRGRLLRGTWRNFYTPDRRDVLGGFRTCALEAVA